MLKKAKQQSSNDFVKGGHGMECKVVAMKSDQNAGINVEQQGDGSEMNAMEPEVLVKVEESSLSQTRVKSKKHKVLYRNANDINSKKIRTKKSLNDIQADNQRNQRSPGSNKGFKDNVIRLTERHFPAPVPQTAAQGSRTQRKCLVCSHTVKRPQRRRDTKYMCVPCNVALCIYPCFEDFHTKIHF